MDFSFDLNSNNYTGGLLYIKTEYSLLYKPFSKNVGVSIMCGAYTSLDTICETGRVMHISGFNSKATWNKRTMDIPKAPKGDLIAHFDVSPMKGTGVDYDRSWSTFYDESKSYICIGKPSIQDGDDCVEFASNMIAVLHKNNLIAIWAQIKEV